MSFDTLPDALQAHVMDLLASASAVALARAACACRSWRALVSPAAERQLCKVYSDVLAMDRSPNWPRALGSAQALGAKMGAQIAHVCWRDEWMKCLQVRLEEETGLPTSHPASAGLLGGFTRDVEKSLSREIDWCVAAGWAPSDARMYQLVLYTTREDFQTAVVDGKRQLASCVHAIYRCVASAARLQTAPAPIAYAPLLGNGMSSLATTDKTWRVLLGQAPAPGLSFVTRTFVDAEEASPQTFPSLHTGGFYQRGDGDEVELVSDVVICFRSRAADASGMRSLIQDGGGGRTRQGVGSSYCMPPFATVTLEEVSDSWRLPSSAGSALRGRTMNCRLLTVSVSYEIA